MNRALAPAFLAAALAAALPLAAAAQVAARVAGPPPQLVVTSVVTDLAGPPCTLMARGRELGRASSRAPLDVRLADEPLDVISSGDTWLIADFDCATPPGDYLLTVRRGPSQTDFDALSLTIGAVGPPGPPGEPGPPGASGLAGYEIVHYVVAYPDADDLQWVPCPPGKRVISGGWHGVVPGFSIEVTESYPLDESTWAFRTRTSDPDTIDFVAICVNE
jgi:hypothetical protein